MVMGSERRREGWMMLVVASLGLGQPSQPRQPSTPGPGLGRYLPLAAPPAQQSLIAGIGASCGVL